MNLGLSTYSYPWAFGVSGYPLKAKMTISDLLDKAIAYGIKVVQIGDNAPLHLLSYNERQMIAEQAKRKNVQLEVGTRRLTIENIDQYLSISEQLNSRFLRMVIDDEGFHPNEEEVIAIIKDALPKFREKNVLLAIENHDRFPSASLQSVITHTDPQRVGICLDTANSLGAGEGINEVLNLLGPYTINLHIKDFEINRVDHKMGFLVKGSPAGEGMLDIPFLIAELQKSKRCQTATLEVWSNPEVNLEATMRKEEDWVKKSVNYLKGLKALDPELEENRR